MKAITFYTASILLTAIFSYSLRAFMHEEWLLFSMKTMLIPCFTWTVLIILAWVKLPGDKRLGFLHVSGLICLWGSVVLVPCGIYNFSSSSPQLIFSVISVFSSVVIMSLLFYLLLPQKDLNLFWWWAFNVLICINMVFFYFSAKY